MGAPTPRTHSDPVVAAAAHAAYANAARLVGPLAAAYYLARVALRALGLGLAVLISLGMVDWVYVRALQSADAACSQLLNQAQGDPTLWHAHVLRDAINDHDALMRRAQHYHARLGRLAWWANDAYEAYYWRVAPMQQAAYYTRGVLLGVYYPPDWLNQGVPADSIVWLTAQSIDRLAIDRHYRETADRF